HLHNEPVLAHAPSARYRAQKFIRRHRVGVLAAAAVAVTLASGVIASTVGMVRARRAEAQARGEGQGKGQGGEVLKGLFKGADPSEAKGNSITARELLDKAVTTIDKLSGEPGIHADLLTILGGVYNNLGLTVPAKELCRRAVDIRRSLLGPEHPDTLASMN